MKPTRWTPEMIEYYTNKGLWTSETWSDIYDRDARLFPDKEAFVAYAGLKRKAKTWGGMKQAIDRLALGFLELGLEKDDRVLCQLPSCIENVALSIGCEKAGLIHCYSPINTWEAENDRFLSGLEATAVVTVPEYHGRNHFELFKRLRNSGKHPHLKYILLVGEEIPEDALSISKMIQTPIEEKYPADFLEGKKVSAYEVQQVMTTTGTTGMPKMVEMPANTSRLHGRGYLEKARFSQDDSCFTTGFLWTGPTTCGLWVMPQVGGRVIMMETFEAEEALQIIERERPTYLSGFPPQIIDMARHPNFDRYDTSSPRFILWAGAPFPSGLARKCEEKFQRPLVSGFGAVDSSMFFLSDMDAPQDIRLECAGKPPSWDECKVVKGDGSLAKPGEIGTLYWRGATSCGGYFRDPERTRQVWGELGLEGWYNTQDAAWLDNDGNVWLVGRTGDMILRGGQNIFPTEIEDILSGHPKVAVVQIVAMPDFRLGEKACAYVIPKRGETFTLREMVTYLEERRMAKYKYPERLEIIESFPMVGQKINKRALALDICRRLLAEGKISEKLAEDFERKRNLSAL